MTNTGNGAVKRIYVKVYGFSEAERHALNTVFSLSEASLVAYALWTAGAPDDAQVVLLDGDNWEASLGLANPENDVLKLVWVGDRPPGIAWRVFARPLRWQEVIGALDQLYAPALVLPRQGASSLDFDLGDHGDAGAATEPMQLQVVQATVHAVRVLVIDADPDVRLYLRAKLAAGGLVQIDEASTGAEVKGLLRFHAYGLVVLDLGLEDVDGWQLLKELGESKPTIEHILVMGEGLTRWQSIRAWFAGARGSLAKPLHPGKLKNLLQKVPTPL